MALNYKLFVDIQNALDVIDYYIQLKPNELNRLSELKNEMLNELRYLKEQNPTNTSMLTSFIEQNKTLLEEFNVTSHRILETGLILTIKIDKPINARDMPNYYKLYPPKGVQQLLITSYDGCTYYNVKFKILFSKIKNHEKIYNKIITLIPEIKEAVYNEVNK